MTKYSKTSSGKYSIHGKTYEMLSGSRAQVWHKTAYKTPGGLTHNDLLQSKTGRIVSRKKHFSAKKENRLVKAGYVTRKGHFGAIGKGKRIGTRSRRKKGGYGLNPASYDGKGESSSGVDVQFLAGNGN